MSKPMKRGLNALLANLEDVRDDVKTEDKIYSVSVEKIVPNPNQPRKIFNEEALKELADSIAEHGIIQPLVVKRDGENYIIIAGERRYRAAIMAGLTEVPVIVRQYDDVKTREIGLIENLQREDLNPMEESEAIRELMEIYGFTQDEIARKLGKARPSIANSLRLLHLTEEVKELVKADKLTAGHARALLSVSDENDQTQLAKKIIEEGWSVRETERQVRAYLETQNTLFPPKKTPPTRPSILMKTFAADMSELFSAKVRVSGDENKGRISIDYASNDDLRRICELIESLKNK